jgi:catechol 2,3-dioxygenase-like lactoylglutathione lyase family enzyme
MNTSATPVFECEQAHAGLAVTDIPAAIDFYTKKHGFNLAFT